MGQGIVIRAGVVVSALAAAQGVLWLMWSVPFLGGSRPDTAEGRNTQAWSMYQMGRVLLPVLTAVSVALLAGGLLNLLLGSVLPGVALAVSVLWAGALGGLRFVRARPNYLADMPEMLGEIEWGTLSPRTGRLILGSLVAVLGVAAVVGLLGLNLQPRGAQPSGIGAEERGLIITPARPGALRRARE